MMAGMMLGMLLLFAVLVPAYGSWTLAGITMITLPLAAMGAAWGLLLGTVLTLFYLPMFYVWVKRGRPAAPVSEGKTP
jgi:multidrug efflux pump subunit AcrB